MKIQENKINQKNVIQIYVSTQENKKDEIQNEMKEIRKQHNNVVVFISGNNEPKNSIQEMVKAVKRQQ